MEELSNKVCNPHSWYLSSNIYNDVVLSTRVRLIRNIQSIPFVKALSDSEKRKVSLIIKSLYQTKKDYDYKSYWELNYNDLHYFQEMNYISSTKNIIDNDIFTDIVTVKDHSFCILVNDEDHFKISSYTAGLNVEEGLRKVLEHESYINTDVSFAKNNEFGFLTSKLNECGTGLKISLRVFIPSIIISGEYMHLSSLLKDRHCFIKKVYPSSRKEELASCLFDIYLNNSIEGNKEEQVAFINTIGKLVVEKERKLRANVADNKPTIVSNQLRQNIGKSLNALLLEYLEGLNIILAVKLGLGVKLIEGINDTDLNSLCYITKGEELQSLIDKNDISFETDVKENNLQVQRFRAIVIQNGLTGITHANKSRKT